MKKTRSLSLALILIASSTFSLFSQTNVGDIKYSQINSNGIAIGKAWNGNGFVYVNSTNITSSVVSSIAWNYIQGVQQNVAPTNSSFVFEGDSITYGFSQTNGSVPWTPYGAYGTVLTNLSFAKGCTSTIVAYNGRTSGSITGVTNTYSNNILFDYTNSIRALRPSTFGGSGGTNVYLNLMIGINDIFYTNSLLNIENNIQSFITQAHADGFKVILNTILDTTAPLYSTANPIQATIHQQLNSDIRANTFNTSTNATNTFGADYIWDANSALNDPTDTNVFFDNLHPTQYGQISLAKSLNSCLSSGGFNVTSPAPYNQNYTISGTLTNWGSATFQGGINVNSITNLVTINATGNSSMVQFGNLSNSINIGSTNTISTNGATIDNFGNTLYIDPAISGALRFATLHQTTITFGTNLTTFNGPISFPSGSIDSTGINVSNITNVVSINTNGSSSIIQFGSSANSINIGSASSLPANGATIDNYGSTLYIDPATSQPLRIATIHQSSVTFGTNVTTFNGPAVIVGGLTLTAGSNQFGGRVTLVNGNATITSSAITTSSVIVLSFATVNGANSYPQVVVSNGSAAIYGLTTDNGSYNWIVINRN